MQSVGRVMLEMFLNADGGDYCDKTIGRGEGQRYDFIAYRDKKLLTVLGPVTVKRAYYYDRQHRKGYCPKE